MGEAKGEKKLFIETLKNEQICIKNASPWFVVFFFAKRIFSFFVYVRKGRSIAKATKSQRKKQRKKDREKTMFKWVYYFIKYNL